MPATRWESICGSPTPISFEVIDAMRHLLKASILMGGVFLALASLGRVIHSAGAIQEETMQQPTSGAGATRTACCW